jgi:EmrB/QacA subfamily drug resistance transporter
MAHTSEHPTHSAQHHAAGFSSNQRTIALVVVALAFVMDLVDSTIVNIAIPSIQTNLGASYSAIQWLIAGYSLAFAALLITGGRMGDVFGYKKLFIVGVAGFTTASLLSGLAWNTDILIAARLIQGSMAALMVPQVMSLMQVMYKPHERTAVMGLFGALGGLAASLGPIIGGILIEANVFHLDWRPIFLINVPIGIFGLIMAYRYLPDGKSAHPLKLDIPGTAIIIAALLLLIFPLIEGRDFEWPLWTFAMIAASVPALGLFAWWQRRKMQIDGSPLVIPALFKFRSFWMGLLINIIFEGALLGFFLTFTLMLQIGLGYDVLKAALTGIPTAVGITLSIAVLGPRILPKLGRYALSIGAVVMIVGLATIAATIHWLGMNITPWEFIPGLLLVGSGMGLIMAPIFAVVLNDVDPQNAGSASGTLNAVQQVGGAIGIALIGVIFFGQLSSHAATSFSAVVPDIQTKLTAAHIPTQTQNMLISGAQSCFVDRSKEKDSSIVPESCQVMEQPVGQSAQMAAMSKTIGHIVTDAALTANETNFDHAFNWGIGYEALLCVITFGLSFFLPRQIKPENPEALV